MPSQSNYQDPQGPPSPPSRNGANTVGATSTAQERPNVTGPTGPTSPGLPPPRPIPEPTTEAPEPNSPPYSERAGALEPEPNSPPYHDSYLNFDPNQNNPDYDPFLDQSIDNETIFRTPAEVVNLQEGVVGVGITGKAVVFSQGTVVDLDQLEGNNLIQGNYDNDLESQVRANELGRIDSENFITNARVVLNTVDQTISRVNSEENYNKDEQKRNNNKLLKRLFGARSFLYRTGNNPFVIPFYENPTIEEKKGVVYQELVILGNDPLINTKNFTTRTVRLTFKLTIPHIAEMLRTEGENELETFLNSKLTQNKLNDAKRAEFFKDTNTLGDNNLNSSRTILFNLRKEFITKTTEIRPPLLGSLKKLISRSEYISFDSKDRNENPIVDYRKNYAVYNAQTDYYLKAQSKVYDYLNHIRTLTEANNNTVYLNYTPIHNNILFAVDGYEIREAANKTYDITTLMCNNYEIVLNLKLPGGGTPNTEQAPDSRTQQQVRAERDNPTG